MVDGEEVRRPSGIRIPPSLLFRRLATQKLGANKNGGIRAFEFGFLFFRPPFSGRNEKGAKRPEIPVLFAPPPLFYTPLSLRGLLPIFPKKTMAIGPSNLRESQTGVNARISLRFSVVSPFFCPERRKRAKQKDTRFATTSVSALFLRGQHP